MNETPAQPRPNPPDRTTAVLRKILAGVAVIILLGAGWLGYAYAFSPSAVRSPYSAHYHFRLQVINHGVVVNFTDPKFQTEFNKDMCDAALTKEPFHFHDGVDQFVHVHWGDVTGGLLLKHYGWNFIGGPDGTLGYQFNALPRLPRVAIHGKSLANPPTDARYYVFVSNPAADSDYREQSWNDFLRMDLKEFFKAKSGQTSSRDWLDMLTPTASAHAGHEHGTEPAAADQAKLAQLNDVLGSIIIFAQKDKPTDAQIKDRFNHLAPLPESSCGG